MSLSLEDLKTALADYEDILTFEEVGEVVKVTMQYQHGPHGKVKWSAVNSIVKEFGGEWVSLGKDSHFKVPRQQTAQPTVNNPLIPQFESVQQNLETAMHAIRRALDLIEKAKT